MENKTLQLQQLKVLLEYMPQVRMIPDLIDKLENQGLNGLLPAHQDAIMKLINKSYKKNEILDKWTSNISTPPATKQVEQVELEYSYFESPLVKHVKERIPIGFKTPEIEPPINRYSLDIVKGKSNAERFDAIFDF